MSLLIAGSEDKSSGLLSQFAISIAAYIFVFLYLCTPGTRFISTPVHHDDFNNLAHTKYLWWAWRPVSYAVLSALSLAGISAYIPSLHILIFIYCFLSLSVLRRLLDVTDLPAL